MGRGWHLTNCMLLSPGSVHDNIINYYCCAEIGVGAPGNLFLVLGVESNLVVRGGGKESGLLDSSPNSGWLVVRAGWGELGVRTL